MSHPTSDPSRATPDPSNRRIRTGSLPVWTPCLCLALAFAPSAAQETIASDRPGIGSGSTVVAPGVIQLEGGFSFSRDELNDTYTLGEALVRIGVRGIEFELFANSFVITRTDALDDLFEGEGFQDLGLGAKVPLIRDRGDGFALSLQGILITPSGSDLFTGDEWVPAGNLLADIALADDLGLSLNAGYRAGPGRTRESFSVIVTPALSLGGGVGAYVGWAGQFSDAGDTHFAEGGITFLASDDLQLDVNGGWDVETDDWFLGAGVAVRRTR